MSPVDPINLPLLPNDVQDTRSYIENWVLDKITEEYGRHYEVNKYYETANEMLYNDIINALQSGVPNVFIRSRREETNAFNPVEKGDELNCTIEIIFASSVKIEKSIRNVDRYVYVMNYLIREVLRANPVSGIHRNRKRPFIYINNRDIFRNKEVDIIIAEYNVNYITV